MNDFEPQAVLEATADVMREQRKDLLARIELLEADLSQKSSYIEALTEEIASARKDVADRLQSSHKTALEQYHTLTAELAELRGRLSSIPADPAPQVAELKGRLDQLERTPGPAGKDANPEDVARVLMSSRGFLNLVRGEQGEEGPRGPEGPPVNLDSLVSQLKGDTEFQELMRGEQGEEGPRGPEGPPVNLDSLVSQLKGDTEFQELVRGVRGELGSPRESVDANEVADRLAANPAFLAKVEGKAGRDGRDGKDGKDGKDGAPGAASDPLVVAQALIDNKTFRDMVRGEKGERGDKGDAGQDGKSVNPLDVIEALKKNEEFQLWVKPDPIAMGKLVEEDLKRCDEFIHATRGKDGRDGAAGAGIDVPYHQPGEVYREGAIVQAAFGKLYKAVKDTSQNPRGSDHWKRFGLFGFEWCGIKDEKRTYEPGDLYIDKGSTFLVLPDGRAKMFAQRGKEGKQGEPGRDGRDGSTVVAGILDGEMLRLQLDDGTKVDVPINQLHEHISSAVKSSFSEIYISLQQTIDSLVKRINDVEQYLLSGAD